MCVYIWLAVINPVILHTFIYIYIYESVCVCIKYMSREKKVDLTHTWVWVPQNKMNGLRVSLLKAEKHWTK